MCAETVVSAGWAGAGECWIGSGAGGSEAGTLEGGCASGHGGGKGLRAWVGPVNVVAAHVFVGGLVAGDLNELDSAKHGDPDQLDDDPDIEDEGESVTGYNVTQRVIDNVALGTRNGG